MSKSLALIVGLGNPGPEYHRTRHNAGADFVSALAAGYGATLKPEARFHGLGARVQIAGHDVRLLVPQTWMNRSGQAVGPAANFFKLVPEQILVAYDELDLPPGEVRFKFDGGHGGHNGLRDIIAALGNNRGFHRLRIGIGHPGAREQVSPHVLSRPSPADRRLIDLCIAEALHVLPDAVSGNWPIAMNRLNSFRAE
ncbi:MAG: aminoacyl-tRNA hydrolase [Pseudomonadales bacterium]|nr:aminoacyl-tRNA hydrolase [Pseudomonadales bacterium]MBP9033775.1 aminoacyl-tRNA hydrolase [Pseudomonadales bacterium]